MDTALITTAQIKVFDQSIFSTIKNLTKEHERADINNIYSETIKTFDFKDITEEYLQDRINAFIINEKIRNKQNKQTGI